jgi:carbon-monoxide dehydrogenase small subunit
MQENYAAAGGSQCGFCTPGFMISIKALLDRNPHPSDEEIRVALSSNFCRCTGYMQIYESIRRTIASGATAPQSSAPVGY